MQWMRKTFRWPDECEPAGQSTSQMVQTLQRDKELSRGDMCHVPPGLVRLRVLSWDNGHQRRREGSVDTARQKANG